MGESAQYPMWMGRAFAFAYSLWLTGKNADSSTVQINQFVDTLIEKLPPPGQLSAEE